MDQLSTVNVLPEVPTSGSRSALRMFTLSGSEATSGMRKTSSLHLPLSCASALPSVSSAGRRSMTTSGFSFSCDIAGTMAATRDNRPRIRVARFKGPPVANWTVPTAPGSIFAGLPAESRELALQEGHEGAAGCFDRGIRLSLCRELRHLQARVTAGIDALERLEVHVHVEGQAVVAGAASDAQPDARDLAAADVHAGRILAALGLDAERGAIRDHGALEGGHEVTHAEAGAADVDEWIDDELAGAMVGHLPAAIDLHHRDVAGREHVARVAVQPLREHRRMLEQPDLVRRVRVARVGDALHFAPGGDVVNSPKPANEWCRGRVVGVGGVRG